MKFIVSAVGSDGDINPMIEISHALALRGHEVDFLANEYFENKVRRAGLAFYPIGDLALFESIVSDPRLWHPRQAFAAVWQTINDTLPLAYKGLEERVASSLSNPSGTGEAPVLVGTTLALAGRVMQEVKGLKLATVHLSPGCLISRYDPPANPDFDFPAGAPQWLKDFYVYLVDTHILDRSCRADVNRFRGQYGLPPVAHIFTKWLHSTDKVIYAFPRWYAEPQADWPPKAVFTGFPLYMQKAGEKLSDKVESFMDADAAAGVAPPVVFTAGSAHAHSREYFERAMRAVNAVGARAVFVSKYKEQLPVSLPDNIIHTEFEPFDLLFAKAAVVCHHGGIGTSAQALRAGVPQFITPFAHDQFDNARRLVGLGVAKSAKPGASDAVWITALRTLVNADSDIRSACAKVEDLMRDNEKAASLIAEELEKLGV